MSIYLYILILICVCYDRVWICTSTTRWWSWASAHPLWTNQAVCLFVSMYVSLSVQLLLYLYVPICVCYDRVWICTSTTRWWSWASAHPLWTNQAVCLFVSMYVSLSVQLLLYLYVPICVCYDRVWICTSTTRWWSWASAHPLWTNQAVCLFVSMYVSLSVQLLLYLYVPICVCYDRVWICTSMTRWWSWASAHPLWTNQAVCVFVSMYVSLSVQLLLYLYVPICVCFDRVWICTSTTRWWSWASAHPLWTNQAVCLFVSMYVSLSVQLLLYLYVPICVCFDRVWICTSTTRWWSWASAHPLWTNQAVCLFVSMYVSLSVQLLLYLYVPICVCFDRVWICTSTTRWWSWASARPLWTS